MATSSITKEFTVKDIEKFNSIIDKVNEPSDKIKVVPSPNLERGKKLLAEFSFR